MAVRLLHWIPAMRKVWTMALLLSLVWLGTGMMSLTRCVVEGSLVDTPDGGRLIENLNVGDRVWSRASDGSLASSTVVAVYPGQTFRYLRMTYSTGRTLDVTPTHPVATEAGWTEAKDVGVGRALVGRAAAVGVVDVDTVWSWRAVYDISVEPHANFFANGVLVHNKRPAAYQAQAIGDSRAVISAMQTYASANCGLFPEDLVDASRFDGTPIAIPGYPANAPEFLGGDLAKLSPYTKAGYERRYQAFDRPDEISSECAQNSARSFCYSSRPTETLRHRSGYQMPDWLARLFGVSGYRSFVATSDGAIYMDWQARDLSCTDGTPPPFAELLE